MAPNFLSRLGFVIGVAAIAATVNLGAVMATTLSEPVSIPLDSIRVVDPPPEWLGQQLKAKGMVDGWTIADGKFQSADLDAIKYVNRIKAFMSLDNSLTRPYFVLPLVDDKGATGTCVTLLPRDIVPELKREDFAVEHFKVPDMQAGKIQACLARGSAGKPYAGMDRAAFLDTYFEEFGVLDIARHKELAEDPDFILKAYELGFYPKKGEVAGYLHVE
jgi:hypothetical protein